MGASGGGEVVLVLVLVLVNVLVLKGPRRTCGRSVLVALVLCSDDGLQVLALPSLLSAVAVCSVRDLLRLVDGRLLHVGAIHGGFSPPRAGLWAGLRLEGCWDAVCG